MATVAQIVFMSKIIYAAKGLHCQSLLKTPVLKLFVDNLDMFNVDFLEFYIKLSLQIQKNEFSD